MAMMPWVKRWSVNDPNIFNMEELQQVMISGMANLQLYDQNLWLARWNTLSVKIDVWLREVAEEDAIFTGSCHTILMEDLGKHRVSATFVPNSWLMIRNCNDFPSTKISSKEQITIKIFKKMSLLVMRCGFMVMTWNQTTTLTLEESRFTLRRGPIIFFFQKGGTFTFFPKKQGHLVKNGTQ
jgi:hypothetical protein